MTEQGDVHDALEQLERRLTDRLDRLEANINARIDKLLEKLASPSANHAPDGMPSSGHARTGDDP